MINLTLEKSKNIYTILYLIIWPPHGKKDNQEQQTLTGPSSPKYLNISESKSKFKTQSLRIVKTSSFCLRLLADKENL